MIRLHLTAEDLARVRLAKGWGPLAETYFSLTRLRREPPGTLGGWAARVGRMSSGLLHPCASLFDGGRLDLFTLTGPAGSIEEGLAALLEVRPKHFRAEIAAARAAAAGHSNRRRGFADAGDPAGDRNDRQRLAAFIHDHYRVAVAPHWAQIDARLSAQHLTLAQLLAARGVDGLLAGLAPFARWRPPVLELGSGPTVNDMTLDGRGLLLVPSVFFDVQPPVWLSGVDDQAPLVLFLPAARGAGDLATILAGPTKVDRLVALARLLGRTRANALDSIGAGPCTTGELARQLDVSPANASEHATVLREAGLIATLRRGRAVRHHVTALGEQLLSGVLPPPSVRSSADMHLADRPGPLSYEGARAPVSRPAPARPA